MNMQNIMKYIALKGVRHWILVVLLLLGAVEGGMITAKYSDQIANFIDPSHIQANISPTIIPTTVDANFIDCFTNGSRIRMTETECLKANGYIIQPTIQPTSKVTIKATIDPDPIIDCTYKYLGLQKIRQSLCSKQFECQIGSKWYFYLDSNKCKQDQLLNSNKNTTKYVYITSAPYPTWVPWPTYAPYPTTSYDIPTTAPIFDLAEYQRLKENCIREYNEKKQGIQNKYGNTTDTGDFAIQQLTKEYQFCFDM